MKYEKPEIIAVDSALVAVKSGMKGTNHPNDSYVQPTIGAYEADE
jgi:hypothetical protein